MDRMKRTRAVVRSAVTRTLNMLTDLLRGPDPDSTDLQVHLDFLLQKEAQLTDLDKQISELVDDDGLENEVVGTLEYNMSISHTVTRVRCALARNHIASDPSQVTDNATVIGDQGQVSAGAGGLSHTPVQRTPRTVALPKLQIPPFSGNLRDWQGFWDHFRATIHDNVDLPRIEKFKYLQTYLTGTAKQAIEWVRLSDEGYELAIKSLFERFGRNSILVDEHIDQLLALAPVHSSNNIAQLRHLYDSIQFRTSCLEGLGVPSTHYSVVLKRVLMRSLPNDLAILFRLNLKEREPPNDSGNYQTGISVPDTTEVATILKFLRIQIESREESQGGIQWTSSVPLQEDRRGTRPSIAHPSSPSALALPTASITPPGPGSCLLCNNVGHQLQDCDSNISPDMKRNRLRAARCCFKCGKINHVARNCRTSTRLVCGTCSGRHITILCDIWRFPQDESRPNLAALSESRRDENRGDSDNHVTSAPTSSTGASSVLLQTAKAWATGTTDSALVRVLLDTGSQRTFIKRETAERLQCQILGTEELTVYTFGNTRHPTNYHCRRVSLTLQSQYSTSKVTIEALEVPDLCTVRTPPLDNDILNQLHSEGLIVADVAPPSLQADTEISVLVGSDLYWKVATGQIRRLTEQLTAVHTLFGWMVQGRYKCSTDCRSNTTALSLISYEIANTGPLPDPSEMWRLDAIGISDLPSSDPATHPALLQFREQIIKKEDRYEVPLMFKHPELGISDNNRMTAVTRLQAQLRRFQHNPELLTQYDDAIRQYFHEGHAERIPASSTPSESVYYLPHHAVVRKGAVTTKLRVVFDASSHAPNMPSLNSVLDKGPKLDADLVQLLLTFRTSPVILTADIQKAFLQIGIRAQDRDALRFLWIEHLPPEDGLPPPLVEWRMTHVPFGASSSPFLLAATLRYHFETMKSHYPSVVSELQNSFYVDDLVVGAASETEALRIYRDATSILAKAGMKLCKWSSNSSRLQSLFLQNGVSYDNATTETDTIKVLGLEWDRTADEVLISTNGASFPPHRATKRTLLQAFSRIFDPLGYLAPFVIRARLLFQTLWIINHAWDKVLTPKEQGEWESWYSELPSLSSLRLPRNALPLTIERDTPVEMHIFVDASPRAYGAAIYLRTPLKQGSFTTNILISRSRIAPIKPVTLPRLELLACLLGARLFDYVKKTTRIAHLQVQFWTDSEIALCWIAGDAARWQQFVRNRVTEIQRLTEGFPWSHCPTHDNPADLLTRGVSATFLLKSQKWWNGPPWLTRSSTDWPVKETRNQLTILPETVASSSTISPVTTSSNTSPLLELSNYSSLSRVIRLTAWIRRFMNNASPSRISLSGPLTSTEVTSAETYWIRVVQIEAFPLEVAALQENRPLPSSSGIHRLLPFIEPQGTMRVGGRLQELIASQDLKHPYLLPPKHRFTELVVLDAHNRLLHGGIQDTLTEVRERFWIPRGRQTVKRVLHSCLPCKRRRLAPETAPMAPLPRERITETGPFNVVGIDFCGPLYVRNNAVDTKAYITVFSCAVTRAIHLELTSRTTSQAFLLAFRRFVSRRGLPSIVYSDNARTFQQSAELLNLASSPEVQDYASGLRIQWRFNVERAPWWGGWWERVIRSLKDCLKRCLGRNSMSYEELTTVLLEVEAVLNSRPLTYYLSSEPDDPQALTPSHFLLGKRAISLPLEVDPTSLSSTPADLRRRAQVRNRTLEHLWKRWRKEYLLQLRSAHISTTASPPRLQIGDVVIVEDDNTPPLLWKLCRVTFPGRDGVTRACTLRLSNGSELRRPVQRLYLLEAGTPSATPPGGGC